MSPRVVWLSAVVLAVAACHKSAPQPNPGPGPLGDGNPTSLNPAANDASFSSPFDATPSPDGTTIYFLAVVQVAGEPTPAVLSVPASGAAATVLASGAPLSSPFGIAVDSAGAHLFIADSSGTSDPNDDSGSVLVMSTTGGAPAPLSGTVGFAPRGVVLVTPTNGTEVVYFTGLDPANGMPGLFSIPPNGGTATVLAEGAPFVDPSGVAVTSAGAAYVADTIATESGTASILEVSSGAASVLATDLLVGYPAGLALSQDEQVLLVSGIDPETHTDEVIRIVLATQATTAITSGISTFGESAGLHRAPGSEVYAWADSQANTTGTVYVLK